MVMIKLIDEVALQKISTLDLGEELQEEVLSMPAFYHHSPKKRGSRNTSQVCYIYKQ